MRGGRGGEVWRLASPTGMIHIEVFRYQKKCPMAVVDRW